MGHWRRPSTLLTLTGLVGIVLWAYWPTFIEMSRKWWTDPQYSQAFLVPFFTLVLLWLRRNRIAESDLRPSRWGMLMLTAGTVMRLAGAYYYFDWLEAISLLPVLAGGALLLGGWPALRWSWLPIGFLVFMIPLPHRVETALSQPLRRLAALAAKYALQTLGQPALTEGNIVIVKDLRMDVAEACSGLGMLLLFIAMAAGVAVLCRRVWWEKLLIVTSAVPIAVVANVLRITVTACLGEALGSRWVEWVHDGAGWFMMPLALVLLGLELHVLSRLFIEVAAARPLPLGLTAPPLAGKPLCSRPEKTLRRG